MRASRSPWWLTARAPAPSAAWKEDCSGQSPQHMSNREFVCHAFSPGCRVYRALRRFLLVGVPNTFASCSDCRACLQTARLDSVVRKPLQDAVQSAVQRLEAVSSSCTSVLFLHFDSSSTVQAQYTADVSHGVRQVREQAVKGGHQAVQCGLLRGAHHAAVRHGSP